MSPAPAAITKMGMGNLGMNRVAARMITREHTPRRRETELISRAVSRICPRSSGASPASAFPPISLGICIRMISTPIPLINPPITGEEMKFTILPAFRK